MPITSSLTNHDLANCLIYVKERLVQSDDIDYITEAITRLRSKNWRSDKINREDIIWAVVQGVSNADSDQVSPDIMKAIVDQVMEALNR